MMDRIYTYPRVRSCPWSLATLPANADDLHALTLGIEHQHASGGTQRRMSLALLNERTANLRD